MDQANAILADTCYCDNVLVAKDVSINLPAVNFLTSEVKAMGSMDVVLVGLLEAMEASITKVGQDEGLSRALTPEKHNYEFRYVQNVTKGDGTAKPEGCKAFFDGGSERHPPDCDRSRQQHRKRDLARSFALSAVRRRRRASLH